MYALVAFILALKFKIDLDSTNVISYSQKN